MTKLPEPFEYFDAAAHWAALSPEQQATVGAAALAYVAGVNAEEVESGDRFGTAQSRAAREAVNLADQHLIDVVSDALPPDAWRDRWARALLPAIIGDVCRVCGCSEHDPCEDGCGWAEKHLCTACAAQDGRITA